MSLPDDPVFHEPWEAQAFAMVVKLHEAGAFSWSEWAETLGAVIKSGDRPYYESWLLALEIIVAEKGMIATPERLARVAAWDRAARSTPHGQPIELSRS